MKHRISAGVIVEHEDRILLVRHLKPGVYDFWVAPGGGAEGDEDLPATARREAREETGLDVEPLKLAYVEDLTSPQMRICKLWFTGRLLGGMLSTGSPEAGQEHIVEAAWLGRDQFAGKAIYPPMLLADYWHDKATGFATPRYVGVREMTFY